MPSVHQTSLRRSRDRHQLFVDRDDTEYVRRMFQLVTNRQPSRQEISQWLNRLQYHNRLRPEMAREFLAMAKGQASRGGSVMAQSNPELVVLNLDAYRKLLAKADANDAIEGIREGIAAHERGEGFPMRESIQRIADKHGIQLKR